ncbi:MAG: hypothetical protein ACTS73_05865 [Arsenophonus sp. NEOnobi-MAG3]
MMLIHTLKKLIPLYLGNIVIINIYQLKTFIRVTTISLQNP